MPLTTSTISTKRWRASTLETGDPLPLAKRLLDIVPNAKDLDAIGFDLRRYRAIANALMRIEVQAAQAADPYLDAE